MTAIRLRVHGDNNTHSDDTPELSSSAHQRRAHALVADQVDRTAHVDVNKVHLRKKSDRSCFTTETTGRATRKVADSIEDHTRAQSNAEGR